LGEKKEEPRGR